MMVKVRSGVPRRLCMKIFAFVPVAVCVPFHMVKSGVYTKKAFVAFATVCLILHHTFVGECLEGF